MLDGVNELTYTILLCDNLDSMRRFYKRVFPFEVQGEGDTGTTFRAGAVLLSLRKRTRDYDGRGGRTDIPGVQLAFRVAPDQVDRCYAELIAGGVEIAEPPVDQLRGHRTVYFFDPEGNLLEIYAEI